MEPGHAVQFEYILGSLSVGVATIDPTSLHVTYANPYLLSLLPHPWSLHGIKGHHLRKILPEEIFQAILPYLQQVAASGQRIRIAELPFEGFLETRGRTYWQVSIERIPAIDLSQPSEEQRPLLITIEDVTETVRSRLHVNAIHHISSAIADSSALPLVLNRILQALQDMVGSRRCSVFLIQQPHMEIEITIPGFSTPRKVSAETPRTAILAAHKNIHALSQSWQPHIDEHTLLGRVEQTRQPLIITDTSLEPEIDLPYLDSNGAPIRPGSVLCVPIFDPYPESCETMQITDRTSRRSYHAPPLLGTLEVYHVRARSFPEEEIKLLERFAIQAGLAIQNARLFRSIDLWAKEANRQANQKENVMQAIPDGIVICDPHWHIVDMNHAVRDLLGWSDEVIGIPLTQALESSHARLQQPNSLQESNSIDALMQQAHTQQSDQLKIIGANGQDYTMHCTYTPIHDEQGDIFAFLIVYHDITGETMARERIEAEVVTRTMELAQRNLALQQAKEEQEIANARLALLLERLPSGVMLVNVPELSVALINQRAIQLLQKIGLPLTATPSSPEAVQQALGNNIDTLFRKIPMHGVDGTPVPYEERPFYLALTQGKASEAELHTFTADGRTLHFLFNSAPLRSVDGTIMSIILVLHEITRTKELERAREDFFTTMAHELKTPLANIRAHLSALLTQDLKWTHDEQMTFLRTADEQVERLVGMINHFLDASRVEAGALRLEREPLLIAEMFEDIQDRLEALISSSRRQLNIICPPQLPAILGDYELIASVLINLLSNAFRYAPENDTVLLKAECLPAQPGQDPAGVKLSVTDHGPGISKDQQSALFTRFSTFAARHRPDAQRPGQVIPEKQTQVRRWSPATGLGLYISKGIIEAHGSKLMLESRSGEGATFSFVLPIYKSQQTE